MIDHTNATHANGPAVVEWLVEGNHLRGYSTNDGNARRIRRWREGENPSIEWLDIALTALGIHLSELPAEVFLDLGEHPRSRHSGGNGPRRRLSDQQVRSLYAAHQRGLSVLALGEQAFERAGFASPASCAEAIRRAFQNLGLPMRTRAEAAKVNYGPTSLRRLCTATTQTGRPCPRPAMLDSDECYQHDERFAEARSGHGRKAVAAREAKRQAVAA